MKTLFDKNVLSEQLRTSDYGPRERLTTDWKYEVPGQDGKVATVKINWGVREALKNLQHLLYSGLPPYFSESVMN